jgi:cobalt-zinc-cadmium efflux system outer membrane protein
LEEALDLLLVNNLELRLASVREAELSGLVQQAIAYPNPDLAVTHEPLWRGGETYNETYLSLRQRVERPGLRRARLEAAEHVTSAARINILTVRFRLVHQVVTAYVEVAAAKKRQRILEEVTGMFRQADAASTAMLVEGEISAFRLRRLRVERARYENQLAAANVEVGAASRRLAVLILPTGEGMEVEVAEGLSEVPRDITLATALAWTFDRAELRSAEEEVQAEQANLRLVQQQRRPTPTFTAGYKNQSDGFDGLFLGGEIRLPVFDRKRGDIAAQEARVTAAETRLALKRRQVESEVRSAHASYASVAKRVDLSRDLLGDLEGLLKAARTSHREGEMSLVELLDAADAYRDARVTMVDLQADLQLAYYSVLRASGQDFMTTR